ncbi:efflux RND transporter permease subunit [Frateuria aurantia]
MNLFAPLVRRPAGVSLLAIGLLLMGILAYALLGVAALPSLDVPGVMVSASLPGASADTMATTVAAPLERHLGRIPGVDQMYSSSSEGATMIQLQFRLSRNTDSAARDVQAAINEAESDLPSSLPSPPQYFKFNTSSIPILLISLTSRGMSSEQLYDLADTLISPALSRVSGVARIQVFGGAAKAVRVELNIHALTSLGLTPLDVRNVLIAANVSEPVGALSNGKTQTMVHTNDALHTAKDFGQLLIKVVNGVPVRLSDVATVKDGSEDIYQAAWFNGERSVNLQLSKRPEANAIETVAAIRAALPGLKALLPANVVITPIFDLTQTTKSALKEVQTSLLISIVLVIVVMLVFLRRIGPTLIATLSVPLSLAGAFVVMWALGYTLNTLSLMALVLCVGFVVDDAIVVIENIVRHMEAGASPMEAALKGVGEIGFTVISITLSLIAVFAPLLFGDTMLVILLREFSVTLTAAVVISAIVSLTVTPALCARFLNHHSQASQPSRWERALERFDQRLLALYARGLDWAMHHRRLMRWQPLILLFATVGLALAVVKTAGGSFMPQEDMGMMQASVRADVNISPGEMKKRLQRIATLIQSDPAVEDVMSILGSDGGGAVGNNGQLFIDLKPYGHGPGQRADRVTEVIRRLSDQAAKIPNIALYLQPVQMLGGGGGGNTKAAQYTFQLISDDGQDVQPAVLKLVRALRARPELKDVSSSLDEVGIEKILYVDRDKASRLGVGMGTIDSVLSYAMAQSPVSVIYSQLTQYRVVLISKTAERATASTLLHTWVPVSASSSSGNPVLTSMTTLGALGELKTQTIPSSVEHQNQLQAADISYNLAPGMTPDRAIKLVGQVAAGIIPAGVRVDFTGDNQRLQEMQSNGTVLLIGAICAMYIVLGILYESLGHPLTILSTLPAAGAGAFLAMLVTHTQLTLIAIIAVLLLIGIVKKNAIMMVDFALTAEREQGLPAPEAIRQAALVRFRPITMTTLVAMGAALPLAIGFGVGSEMRQPLGIAIVGGLLVSQLLTLLSTPAIYLWNHDRKLRKAARQARRQARRAARIA